MNTKKTFVHGRQGRFQKALHFLCKPLACYDDIVNNNGEAENRQE